MNSRGKTIQATLVLFGTFGIIVPLSVLLLPSMGKFPPPQPIIPQNEPVPFIRPAKSQLSLYISGINELSTFDRIKLLPEQKKHLVAAMEPWLAKPTMGEAQAKNLNKKLADVLTHEQRLHIKDWIASYYGYGPRAYTNDAQGRAIQSFRQTYNPFYPPEKHRLFSRLPREMQERYKVRYEQRRTFLRQWRKVAE